MCASVLRRPSSGGLNRDELILCVMSYYLLCMLVLRMLYLYTQGINKQQGVVRYTLWFSCPLEYWQRGRGPRRRPSRAELQLPIFGGYLRAFPLYVPRQDSPTSPRHTIYMVCGRKSGELGSLSGFDTK